MDGIIELGEIGIKRNIPQELIDLASKNNKLKAETKKLKTAIWILGILIVVVAVYHFRDKGDTNKEVNKEDEYPDFK
jgi:hypothetical protein